MLPAMTKAPKKAQGELQKKAQQGARKQNDETPDDASAQQTLEQNLSAKLASVYFYIPFNEHGTPIATIHLHKGPPKPTSYTHIEDPKVIELPRRDTLALYLRAKYPQVSRMIVWLHVDPGARPSVAEGLDHEDTLLDFMSVLQILVEIRDTCEIMLMVNTLNSGALYERFRDMLVNVETEDMGRGLVKPDVGGKLFGFEGQKEYLTWQEEDAWDEAYFASAATASAQAMTSKGRKAPLASKPEAVWDEASFTSAAEASAQALTSKGKGRRAD